jgi:hypothetical protein
MNDTKTADCRFERRRARFAAIAKGYGLDPDLQEPFDDEELRAVLAGEERCRRYALVCCDESDATVRFCDTLGEALSEAAEAGSAPLTPRAPVEIADLEADRRFQVELRAQLGAPIKPETTRPTPWSR